MSRLYKVRLIVFALFFLSGCVSFDGATMNSSSMPNESSRRNLVTRLRNVTAVQREKFIRGEPWVGMKEKELNLLLGGEPGKRQRRISSAGSQEILIYKVSVGSFDEEDLTTKFFKIKMIEGVLSELKELDSYDDNLETF